MIILVTGGARRLGAGLVNHFCHQGHQVVLHYHQSAKEALELQQTWGERVFLLQADLRQTEAAQQMIATIAFHFGGLDAIVNNASVFERLPLDELAADRMHDTWQVNAASPIQLIRAGRTLLEHGHGAVVNMVDNASHHRPWPNYAGYAASKAALLAATRSLAVELAPHIRLNAVGPGMIQFDEDEEFSNLRQKIPMGRFGTMADIVHTVDFFLFGPEYITGQVIHVDGGWSIAP